jgi:ABC-type multidrug transport system fused ATPase/permease subunit
MCLPDIHLIMIAGVFLLLAAVAQVYIPRFLGHILDNLSIIDREGWDKNSSIYDIPHFVTNVKLLVGVSILAGIFSGLRGSIFVSEQPVPCPCCAICD